MAFAAHHRQSFVHDDKVLTIHRCHSCALLCVHAVHLSILTRHLTHKARQTQTEHHGTGVPNFLSDRGMYGMFLHRLVRRCAYCALGFLVLGVIVAERACLIPHPETWMNNS